MEYRFIYVTMPDDRSAKHLAKSIVIERLAACANIYRGVEAYYWWEGVVQEEKEAVLVFKTTKDKEQLLIDRVVSLHPYDTACVVSLPIQAGFTPFLSWIRDEVTKSRVVIDDLESFPEEEV